MGQAQQAEMVRGKSWRCVWNDSRRQLLPTAAGGVLARCPKLINIVAPFILLTAVAPCAFSGCAGGAGGDGKLGTGAY